MRCPLLPNQQGITKIRHSTIDEPIPSGAEPKTYKFPDFHVCWISITAMFQGVTDEPTEAEKLAKMGTYNITTKSGKGSHITNHDFNDLYYENEHKLNQGEPAYLVGDGGGDDDFHGMEFIIDAGCGKRIQSTCGWKKDDDGKLEINFIADSGLDNGRIRVTFWGYEGRTPSRVRKVKFLSEAGVTGEEGSDIKFSDNDLLQSIFAFETTERNLATIQTLDGYTVKEIRIKQNGNDVSDKFYGSELASGFKNVNTEYCGITYDQALDGMGLPVSKETVVSILAGASDAMRVYTSVLERV